MPRTSEEAALDAARNLLGLEVEEETEEEMTDSADEETEGEEDAQAIVLPTFELQLPDDLAEELELDDLTTEEDDEEEDLEDVDPAVLARLRKAEKEAKHFRELRARDGRKAWAEEAKKVAPLSEPLLGEITAESRKEYIRQAKALHNKLAPFVEERVLAPSRAAIEAEKTAARAEARAAAEKAWGKVPGSATGPSDVSVTNDRVVAARNKKDLAGAIRAMMGG